jgi:hypothetical protein
MSMTMSGRSGVPDAIVAESKPTKPRTKIETRYFNEDIPLIGAGKCLRHHITLVKTTDLSLPIF